MKYGSIFVFLFILIMPGCGKDKFQTKPQLKFKSKNTDVVQLNQALRINIEYTDKEGDVDDSLLVVRQRLNRRGPLSLLSPYGIPKFPDTNKGEFEVTFAYQFHLIVGMPAIRVPGSNPPRNEPDTLRLKFVARDKAGNKSDTLYVDNIVVIR
jgi:hypothetical protein